MPLYSFQTTIRITYEEWKKVNERYQWNEKTNRYVDNEGNIGIVIPQGEYKLLDYVTICYAESELVYQVEKALIERGYEASLNNEMDEKDKRMIEKFQKENNLDEIGVLGIETLTALGLYE